MHIFYQFYFEFSLLNSFHSVSKDWSPSLRQFSLLQGAHQRFFVHSSVLVDETSCPLHITKELSTPDNTVYVLEKCIQRVHVLLIESECIQVFQKHFNVSYWNDLISIFGYLKEHYSCYLIVESFSEQMNMKNMVLLLFVQNLPEKERSSLIGHVKLQWPKKEKSPFMEMSRDKDQKRCLYN